MMIESYKTQSCVLIALLAVMILTSGCATPNITKDRVLDTSEGILITRVHSNYPKMKIEVRKEGNFLRVAQLQGPEEYIAVIPSIGGKISFSSLEIGSLSAYVGGASFIIEPGTATYVGDIFINSRFEDPGPWSGKGWVNFEVLDREEETLAEVKKEYPWLLDKYAYRKSIPSFMLETDKNYRELPEMKELKDRIKAEKQKKQADEKGKEAGK